MKKHPARNKSAYARFASFHQRVGELVAQIEPDGYNILLEDLRKTFRPQGVEVRLVELMAELSCRLRGCLYLENEILTQGMAACATPDDLPGDALARAFIQDFTGPGLIEKLSRYESRLSTEFSRCLRGMQERMARRKRTESTESTAAAALAKRQPCTSVIQ